MKILIDSREKNNSHIKNWLTKNGYLFEIRKLDFGDYSFEIDGKSFENKIVIERKSGKLNHGGGFSELKNNIMSSHKKKDGWEKNIMRFNREFTKARNCKAEVFLMLENCSSIDNLYDCPTHMTERRAYQSNALYSVLLSNWYENENKNREAVGLCPVKITYTMLTNSAEKMIEIFKNYLSKM